MSDGWVRCSAAAARPSWPCSAIATNPSSRDSMHSIDISMNAINRIDWTRSTSPDLRWQRWAHQRPDLRSSRGRDPRPLGARPALRGHRAPLRGRGGRTPARLASASSTRSPGRVPSASGAAARAPVRQRARGDDRRPGRADGARRTRGDLPQRLAGRGRREPRRAGLPRSEPVPGEQRARGRAAHLERAAPGRPDRVLGGAQRPPLDGADRRRCGGRLRRPAERLRADARA